MNDQQEKLATENWERKPKWLQKLEEESWQAELVISGLAIFGTLQLPDYIHSFLDWSITFFQPANYFWLSMFFLYLYCASNILIVCFILHFVLRTIWIGMLGLNYVFPKGINYNFKQYSPYFLKKLEERFPNNYQDIIQLERACSAMFGIATMALIFTFTISINILLLVAVKTLIELLLPASWVNIIGIAFVIIYIIAVVLMGWMNKKKYHDNEKVQHWYFTISQYFTKITYHFLYYPINRITFLFVTNSSIKKFGYYTAGIAFALGILTSFQIGQSNFRFLIDADRINQQYRRTDIAIASHYENNLNGTQKLFSAVIPNEKISGSLLKVFVPVFSNESILMDSLCTEWETDESLTRAENRLQKNLFWLQCAEKYHQFYVNDSLYTAELVSYHHPNKRERGILTYLPTQNFVTGKNILRIEKIKNNGKIYRTINIPFWFTPD